jgi:2-phospho-L-lactate/phosphoenolpyruvate guanylyltransferase
MLRMRRSGRRHSVSWSGSYTRCVNVALLVPIKAFALAKQRLSPVLTAPERSELARWLAERVVRAARHVPVYVVCDDQSVRLWADGVGASVLWTAQRGLNGAVNDGVGAITRAGYDHVIVAHADLALPEGLIDTVRSGFATFVPDRRRDGTNVMAFPTAMPIEASYGPGSFVRHCTAALRQPNEVRPDTHLSLDLDAPSDLTHPLLREVLPAWLPMIPANHF